MLATDAKVVNLEQINSFLWYNLILGNDYTIKGNTTKFALDYEEGTYLI